MNLFDFAVFLFFVSLIFVSCINFGFIMISGNVTRPFSLDTLKMFIICTNNCPICNFNFIEYVMEIKLSSLFL